MMRPFTLAQHTLFADLLDQGEEGLFDPEFPENGSVVVRPGRTGALAGHVYYHGYRPTVGEAGRIKRYARYLGRSDDPTVASRTARFERVKAVRAERTDTVRALVGAGMARPQRIAGHIIEALAKARSFSSEAVLVGSVAFQTYDGVLGVRLSKTVRVAANNPLVIAFAVRDRERIGDILNVLRTVDPGFALVGGQTSPPSRETIRSATGVQVEVLVGRGEDGPSCPTSFLIERPARSLVLHGPGIPVAVAAPERYVASSILARPGYRESGVTIGPDAIAELTKALRMAGREKALERSFTEAEGLIGLSNQQGD